VCAADSRLGILRVAQNDSAEGLSSVTLDRAESLSSGGMAMTTSSDDGGESRTRHGTRARLERARVHNLYCYVFGAVDVTGTGAGVGAGG
jgi:hypothetical protein